MPTKNPMTAPVGPEDINPKMAAMTANWNFTLRS